MILFGRVGSWLQSWTAPLVGAHFILGHESVTYCTKMNSCPSVLWALTTSVQLPAWKVHYHWLCCWRCLIFLVKKSGWIYNVAISSVVNLFSRPRPPDQNEHFDELQTSPLFTIPNLCRLPNIKLINYSPRLPHNSLINKKKVCHSVQLWPRVT